MPQIVFDPSAAKRTSNPSSWKPENPIPPEIRSFGFCADFSPLLPGDLVLFSAINPDCIAKAIRKVQEVGGYSKDDARWEHAAVYIGDEAICEATRRGVRIGSLYDYLLKYKIRFRRNDSLTQDQRWNLAVHALRLQKIYKYGFYSIVELYFKSKIGFWKGNKSPKSFPKRSVYCSELYGEAHFRASGIYPKNNRSDEITPACLSSNTTSLRDVHVPWVKIE